jgi:YidC/Oxa1 family membrane protein insertase
MHELKLDVIKRYSLRPAPAEHIEDVNYPAYEIQLDVELHNTSEALQDGVAYRLEGPTGMPIEGWWFAHKISQRWFAAAGLRDVVVRFDGSPVKQIDGPLIAKEDIEPMGQGRALAFAGVDGVYFSAVMIPKKPLNGVWFDTTEAVVVGPRPDARTPLTFTNVTCRLNREQVKLAPGASHQDSFQIFLGPKRPDLLSQYQAGGDPNYSLHDIIYYGWAIFGAVAQAMLAVLHFFYGIVGNYGIAIIMLTVLVRGALFPISYKQTQSMARMQALKPEMDHITEKYKADMQKRSQAIQELYRKHKINPLGGCLPVFLQLPIFIGLYRALAIDVELRQSPLFSSAIRWCSNLAAPDMLWNWSAIMPNFINDGQGLFGLGPYLNILPLITVALFLVTQKMAMPAPTNEQAAMQQKMMKYMTVFMGVLFYKVASGLCLYFIASSLWGIGERKLLPKTQPLGSSAEKSPSTVTLKESGNRPDISSPKNGQVGSAAPKRPRKAKRKR